MERLSLKTFCTLLLAACVAFAINVSAFQASGMAAKMTVLAEISAMTHGDCDTCPGGDKDNAAACITACTVTIVAVLPAAMSPDTQRPAELPLPVHLTAHGKFSAPDPYPPKPRNL